MTTRVLVVEDNDLNFELVDAILSDMGLAVSRAVTGDDAIAAVDADPPDLIYMDIQLPGTDGLEVAHKLKADDRTKHIPIVALTARAMVGDADRALSAGCDGYLTKPFLAEDLRRTTRRFLPTVTR